MLVKAAFGDQRHGFTQSFDGRGDEEIAAEFYQVRARRLVAKMKRLLSDGFKQRHARLNSVRGTCSDDEQLCRRCRFRPSEDRSRDESLAGFRMLGCELLREGNADGAR